MRKLLLISFFVLMTISNSLCQDRGVIYQEKFDATGFPVGWSIMGDGASNWMIAQSCNAGGEPNELQFGWTPLFEGLSRIITAPINFTGITSATISFKHSVDVYEGSSTIGIATSSNNGNSWNTVWSETYDTDGIYEVEALFNSPDLGKDNVMMCLFFEGSSYNINFWFFDDIVIESQNANDVSLISINNHDYILAGENEFSFTMQNIGEIKVESFEASYTIDGETVSETFSTDLPPMERETYTFETTKYLELGSHNIEIEVTSVNGEEDQNATNNIIEKEIVTAPSLAQRIPMIEHFSSSTCGPCVSVNALMKKLTEDNAGRFTYVKYPMSWPAIGDPYYTSEGGIRKSFYNVSGVPTLFLDGSIDETSVITQEELDANYNLPSAVNIRGSFNMEGNTINITADFMSYIDIQNVEAFISINEKTTTENTGSNGETEFHHIMMKMENADGNEISINAGEYQRIEFSHDMSTTHVEDINDLEVAIWLQDTDTKKMFNSRFAYEYTEHVFPVENLRLEEDGNNNIIISWYAPQNENASGYNIYINNVLAAENNTALSYTHPMDETGTYFVEVVALYGEKTSVGTFGTIDAVLDINESASDNISIYPNPAKDVVKLSANSHQLSAVRIYNCLGMLVDEITVGTRLATSTVKVETQHATSIEINVSDYNAGIYFIDVETSNGNFIKKMIIE